MSDGVDWSTLPGAYGPATEIPTLLRQAVSAVPDERRKAIAELWGNLCHQGTVYEASVVAVPFLLDAAGSPHLSPAEREQLLALVVHIGLGEDTTWQGYTSWSVVQDSARAGAAALPRLTTWALEGCPEARPWALALAAHHPNAWASLGVDAAQLMPGASTAKIHFVRHAVSGTRPSEELVLEILAAEPDLRDYDEEVISEASEDRRARMMVLELVATGRL